MHRASIKLKGFHEPSNNFNTLLNLILISLPMMLCTHEL